MWIHFIFRYRLPHSQPEKLVFGTAIRTAVLFHQTFLDFPSSFVCFTNLILFSFEKGRRRGVGIIGIIKQ